MRIRWTACALLVAALAFAPQAGAQDDTPTGPPAIAEKVEGLRRLDGLFTLYVDDAKNTLWLRLPAPTGERGLIGSYIYVEGIATGLGSNPVGLDRGQLGESKIVEIRRIGGKIVFEQPNLAFRALTDDALERNAVRESFATSVLWAGAVAAEDDDGACLVDITSFVVSDAHGVVQSLKRSGQGAFSLDKDRSFLTPDACFAFPDNVELEATLTFTGSEPGREVRETAPTPGAITITQHHSFIRLPEAGYTPREFDPRAGAFSVQFKDYASGVDEPLIKRWIVRHRLEKTDPAAASSPVVAPIVYYVDRGAPEPIRTALVEGARWWAEAFEAAGFENAYRVEIMPEGAHPLDVRYNVIQWVHRSTRGWSYGGSVVDPRTGEILKGHVTLGSLRIRQDRMIFEGLLGVGTTGAGGPDDPLELALARIRQLSAHEVGHTLGFAHNYIASTYADRASVMDYPAPWVKATDDGGLDIADAYGVGIGAWDIHSVRYAYSQFSPGADERASLGAIVEEGLAEGMLFLSDEVARPAGASDPRVNLWDNGEDPVEELENTLRVRAIALANFGTRNVREGRPMAELRETLVPIYLYHRYQAEGAVKALGGMEYHYAFAGDGQTPTSALHGDYQRRALDLLLRCLEPETLALPESVLVLLAPQPMGYGWSAEEFDSDMGPVFDASVAAEVAADIVLAGLLHPDRCARLVDFHERAPSLPSLEEVLDALIDRVFPGDVETEARLASARQAVQRALLQRQIRAAASDRTPARVRWRIEAALEDLGPRLELRSRASGRLASQATQDRGMAREIARFLARASQPADLPAPTPDAPPGSPIGDESHALWRWSWGACSMGG
ncbi:MAG: zinc-dependent metalloprotease [Phycisphaerales bacterium]